MTRTIRTLLVLIDNDERMKVHRVGSLHWQFMAVVGRYLIPETRITWGRHLIWCRNRVWFIVQYSFSWICNINCELPGLVDLVCKIYSLRIEYRSLPPDGRRLYPQDTWICKLRKAGGWGSGHAVLPVNENYCREISSPSTVIAISFSASSGGSHSKNTGLTVYCANVMACIAFPAGWIIHTYVQANRYAGIGPNASIRYAYSAPDLGMLVPSSM